VDQVLELRLIAHGRGENSVSEVVVVGGHS
jgi:hypothetical protein